MPVPGDPPATTTPAAFKTWAQNVVDTLEAHDTDKADDADVVHDTGAETIAGVKTFSSDPIIPDEAYGSGWNGVLEPPTKNAVYDKIETIGSSFAPYAATSKVWLSAGLFYLGLGSPSQTIQNGFSVWLFDAASAENVIASVSLPAHWTTYSLKLYWTNNAGGSGNVVWRHSYKTATDGNSFTAASTGGTAATIAAPTAGTLKVSTLETSIAVSSSGGLNTIIVDRVATDAADTLANDAAMLGVLLERAS